MVFGRIPTRRRTDRPDFSRLSALWHDVGQAIGGDPVRVSTTVPDYEICFDSADWSVGLRRDDSWWVLDTIDDRNQERRSAARFSSFALVEKYLLWDWGATANPALASGKLGPDLARRGFAPQVTVTKVEGGHQICLNDDCAVLRGIVNTCGSACFRRPPFRLADRRLRAVSVG